MASIIPGTPHAFYFALWFAWIQKNLFFALLHPPYWMQTEELTMREAWEQGYQCSLYSEPSLIWTPLIKPSLPKNTDIHGYFATNPKMSLIQCFCYTWCWWLFEFGSIVKHVTIMTCQSDTLYTLHPKYEQEAAPIKLYIRIMFIFTSSSDCNSTNRNTIQACKQQKNISNGVVSMHLIGWRGLANRPNNK